MTNLNIFGMIFKKIIATFKIYTLEFDKMLRILHEKRSSNLTPKMPKNYSRIRNQHPKICQQ